MQVIHLSSSEQKTTTTKACHPPKLLAIGVIGAAMVDFQVNRTPTAQARLQGAADMARCLGILDGTDAMVIANLLAAKGGTL